MRRNVLLVLLLVSPVWAKPEFSVDLQVGWGRCYVPSQWTPVLVTLRGKGLAGPVGGVVEVSCPQDDLTKLTITQPVVLANGSVRLPMVTRLAFGAPDLTVTLRDRQGRKLADSRYEPYQFATADQALVAPLKSSDVLIGVSGRESFGLSRLGEFVTSQSDDGSGRVYVKTRLPADLPWDAAGYASLDVLVLSSPAWSRMTVEQGEAIVRWVRGGGVLLVAMGAEPIPADHPLADLLPCRLELPVRTTVSNAAWEAEGESPLPAWRLERRQGRIIVAESTFGSDRSLLMVGLAGFGRCGVLGFDPSSGAGERAEPKQRATFWRGVLGEVLESSEQRGKRLQAGPPGDDDEEAMFWSYEPGPAAEATNAVLGHLLDIPELEPMSIWWVVGLLSLLAVLLGPVDYIVLKRLDRQPMTWLTSTVLIVLFTAGAYFGVRALRAGRMQVRAVSLVDILPDGTARASRYVGLFAPASDAYELTGVQRGQWWSAVAPAREESFSFQQTLASRNLTCVQVDGSNLPAPIPINIWSMQCMLCEDPDPAVPITAKLVSGQEGPGLRIVNRGETPIDSGTLEFRGRTVVLGRVEPGETKTVAIPVEAAAPTETPVKVRTGWRRSLSKTHATGPRTAGLKTRLAHGQILLTAVYDSAPLPIGVLDRQYRTDHVQVVRMVIDAPQQRSNP